MTIKIVHPFNISPATKGRAKLNIMELPSWFHYNSYELQTPESGSFQTLNSQSARATLSLTKSCISDGGQWPTNRSGMMGKKRIIVVM